jgi:hypothetical protein
MVKPASAQANKPGRQGTSSIWRFAAVVRWAKNNPIMTAISILASIFAFIKGIPPTWEAAMELSGRPSCFSYGDTYYHSAGYFRLASDGIWSEYPPYDGDHSFEFKEVRRDREYIYLRNITPREGRASTMLVRLPACGGAAQWTYQNPQAWIDLYQVWK